MKKKEISIGLTCIFLYLLSSVVITSGINPGMPSGVMGIVKDQKTGYNIQGVSVKLFRGNNKYPSLKTITSHTGYYDLVFGSGLITKPETVRLEYKISGYHTKNVYVLISPRRMTSKNVVLNPTNPDNKDPTVNILAPENGATVKKIVTVKAKASDNIGIKQVNFYIDGKLKFVDKKNPYEWKWNTYLSRNGEHKVKCIALDHSNNVAFSEIKVKVNNPDNCDPIIKIIRPYADRQFKPGSKIPVIVQYHDNIGVKKIVLYLNDKEKAKKEGNLGKDGRITFRLLLPYKNGAQIIKAVGYDTTGNTDSYQVRVFTIG